MTEAPKWQVVVTVPMNLRCDQHDALFEAIADAVDEWEPKQRDGWDADVSGQPVPSADPATIERVARALHTHDAERIRADPYNVLGAPNWEHDTEENRDMYRTRADVAVRALQGGAS